MEVYLKDRFKIPEIQKFIVIFYFIGFLGFIIPFTNEIFNFLTPLALLLSIFLLAIYHKDYTVRTITVFAGIYLIGLLVEIAGVNSGMLFGQYSYGKSLGPKIFETPLIIGFNWLFLTYTVTSVVDRFNINEALKIIFSSLLMVIYDLVIEQVAGKMDMWHWENTDVPLQNYITWFVVSLVLMSILRLAKVKTDNKLSLILFLSQFCFFLLLLIFFTLNK